MKLYDIHGGCHSISGEIDTVEAHGGVFYLHGNINNFVHHGGVVYDQRPSSRVEYKFDSVKENELEKLRMQVCELERRYRQSESERLKLRTKLLNEKEEQPERIPDDDVLVRRIRSLEHQLLNERESRKREVDDLKERLDVAMEINAKLRAHKDEQKLQWTQRSQDIADSHIDILATIMSLFPSTPTKDIAFEFGISRDKIDFLARTLGVIKSKDERDAAREYLRAQGIKLADRRGGDQRHHTNMRPVELVSRNGRILNTFDSIVAAANATGYDQNKVGYMCRNKKKTYTKEGYTFRYKKQ